MNRKVKTALLSIISNSCLIGMKVVAGILSGSISIISEAIHSGMDLIAALIAFFSVRESAKPADQEHPFGHGKIENISALIEGALIFVAAGLIISEAVKKLMQPQPIENSEIAIAVMLVAAVVNIFVSRRLYKVGREEDSMALVADALHLKTDVLTSLGVGVGLILIRLTGQHILDPIAAILVALLIIKESWELCSKAFAHIVDHRIDDDEENKVRAILDRYLADRHIYGYHKLKTRKAGSERHVDFHIYLDARKTVADAHTLTGHLKKEISEALGHTRTTVHIDPWVDEAAGAKKADEV